MQAPSPKIFEKKTLCSVQSFLLGGEMVSGESRIQLQDDTIPEYGLKLLPAAEVEI